MQETTKAKIIRLYSKGRKKPYQIGKLLGHKPPFTYVYQVIKAYKNAGPK